MPLIKPPQALSLALAILLGGCCINCKESAKTASPTPISSNAVLWQMREGDMATAYQSYQTRARSSLGPDYNLLRHMAMDTLAKGIRSNDPEIQFLSVAGAQFALTDDSQQLLEEAAESRYPEVQLAAIHTLAQSGHTDSAIVIAHALGSRFLLLRMHAAYLLSHLQKDDALDQIHALMTKAPEELTIYYPLFLAPMESPEATAQLRRLMHTESAVTAANAISIAAATGRDDLLSDVRQLSQGLDPIRQEVCADALAHLGDSTSVDQLKQLANSAVPTVKLAAFHALLKLHQAEFTPQLLALAANTKDLFAIASLKDTEAAAPLLLSLMADPDLNVRTNAAIALLHQRDSRSLYPLADVLIQDARDLALIETRSPGGVFRAWRVVPSSHEHYRRDPAVLAEALAFREELLSEASLLPQADFLAFANAVLAHNQRELIPHTMALIEKQGTPEATQFLQQLQQTPGQPLIRLFAALSLYRLGIPGTAEADLQEWLADSRNHELIQFRPRRPMNDRQSEPYQELTPTEMSRLLIETCIALTEKQQTAGIDTLVTLIAEGNPRNRYVLAGLLVRATL